MTLYDHFTEKQWQLLEQRAKRVEKAVKAEDTSNMEEVLVVKFGREQYAIPVVAVQAVYENITIHSLPSTPDYIAGIANIRGHITTVMHLPHILDTPVSPLEDMGHLILLAIPGSHIGIQVEAVKEVRQVTRQQVASIQNEHDDYIQGVLPDGTIYLDIQSIVNDPALLVNESL